MTLVDFIFRHATFIYTFFYVANDVNTSINLFESQGFWAFMVGGCSRSTSEGVGLLELMMGAESAMAEPNPTFPTGTRVATGFYGRRLLCAD